MYARKTCAGSDETFSALHSAETCIAIRPSMPTGRQQERPAMAVSFRVCDGAFGKYVARFRRRR